MITSQRDDSPLVRAAKIINRGGVIAFRTDTLYGLGVNPLNRVAVLKVRELKGREDDKPILVLISDVDQLTRFVPNRSKTFDELAERFWPGPLTLIGEASDDLPSELTAGSKTIGVRLPGDDRVRALVRACGGALTATSANPAGEPPARTGKAARNYFDKDVDAVIDDGESATEQPSTVVDCTGETARLIRGGVIAWADIQRALT